LFFCLAALTHGRALPTAPRPTLSSEQGHLSLQHLHPADKLLDGGGWWTAACSFWDVDTVSECYLKKKKKKKKKNNKKTKTKKIKKTKKTKKK